MSKIKNECNRSSSQVHYKLRVSWDDQDSTKNHSYHSVMSEEVQNP